MQFRYISDLHLYDSYSTEWRTSYTTLDSYATDLLRVWNKYTSKEDIIIIVGDIGYYCEKTLNVFNKLNGTKVLIVGNHDLSWGRNLQTCGLFKGIHHSFDCNGIHIEHKPTGNKGKCQWYIHGHHHRYDMPGMYKTLLQYSYDSYRFNCAADLLNNKPCTLQELILNKELLIDSLVVKEEF